MTLGVFCIGQKSLIHVCDRRITSGKRVVSDKANKTLIVRANDGIYSVSYTGPALLHKEGTDHCLAEIITGVKLDPKWSHCPIPEQNKTSSQIVWIIKQALQAILESNRVYRPHQMKVVVAGYSWPKSRHGLAAPMVYEIIKGINNAEFMIKGLSRTKSLSYRKGGFDLFFAPDGWVSTSEITDLKTTISQARSVQDVEKALRDRILQTTTKTHTIGTDIMTVVLPYPSVQQIAVKFESLNPNSLSYTPWVIGSNFLHQPFQFQSAPGVEVPLGFVTFSSLNPWYDKKIKVGDTVLTPIFVSSPVDKK